MDLNLAPTPSPEADRLDELLDRRDETNAGRVPLGLAFLDDCLGGLFPGGLLLWGSGTGVGKTGLAVSAALSGLRAGLERVHLFALEAERGEVAGRLYFQELGRLAQDPRLDFASWWHGKWKHLDAKYGAQIKANLRPLLMRLHVLYKGRGDFTVLNLSQQLEALASTSNMVILDHIHMVDEDRGTTEMQGQKRTIQTLRDLALESRLPVCVVSHVRKKAQGERGVVMPGVEDLHGSSALSKVATEVVLFARDWNAPQPRKHLSGTLVSVVKDRRGRGSEKRVARIYYDMSSGTYEDTYQVGSLVWDRDARGQVWQPSPLNQIPEWAVNDVNVKLAADQGLPL